MGSIDEISTLCRLCLVKDQVNKPIFDADSDIKQTFEKINSCLPVKVSPDDDLPKMICDGCFHKLDILYDFRSTSLESEKHLISLLEKAGLKSKPLTNDHESEKPITVKQENIEASDRLSEDENDDNQITDDSQSYIVQQQKLAYQKDFKFSAASGSKLEESVDDPDEPEEPKPKRARRAAALTAIKSLPIETEDDEEEEEDMDGTMEITKEEDEESDTMDNTEFPEGDEVPSTSTEDQQPGPSGVGKNVEAPFCCQYCDYKAWKSNRLKLHIMAQHTKTYPHQCDKCEFKSVTKHRLRYHVKVEHEGIRFSCHLCSKTFKSAEARHTHQKLHNEQYARDNCTCFICDKICSTVFQLKHHINLHSKKFTCGVCKKVFATRKTLTNHEANHAAIRDNLCQLCGKNFYSEILLKRHVEIHMRPSSKFVCEHCGKTYISKQVLRRHYLVHTGERAHACDVCKKAFSTLKYLKEHKTIHSGEKPFVCSFCGRTFRLKFVLSAHERTHTKEKPFLCKICGRRFSQHTVMKNHMKSHTGDTSYPCSNCQKSYLSKRQLDKHKCIM